MVASISFSTAGSSRKLSHESRRKRVASLLAELAASEFMKRNLARSRCMIETQPVRVIVFFGGDVCIPDLELVQLMLQNTWLIRLIVQQVQDMISRRSDDQLQRT